MGFTRDFRSLTGGVVGLVGGGGASEYGAAVRPVRLALPCRGSAENDGEIDYDHDSGNCDEAAAASDEDDADTAETVQQYKNFTRRSSMPMAASFSCAPRQCSRA